MSARRRNPSRLGTTLYTESVLQRTAALTLLPLSLLLLCSCRFNDRPAGSVAPGSAWTAGLSIPAHTKSVNLHPASPPAPVTNLTVTWTVAYPMPPAMDQQHRTIPFVTWIEENNGGAWYQRTPAFTPQPTNSAVIANTNVSGMLRAAWGWK